MVPKISIGHLLLIKNILMQIFHSTPRRKKSAIKLSISLILRLKHIVLKKNETYIYSRKNKKNDTKT